jgi:hypothetical protein
MIQDPTPLLSSTEANSAVNIANGANKVSKKLASADVADDNFDPWREREKALMELEEQVIIHVSMYLCI